MHRPTFMEMGSLIPFFIMSGAGNLSPRALQTMGSAAAMVLPAYQRMADVITTLRRESHSIWEGRKTAQKGVDGLGYSDELLGILRAFSPNILHFEPVKQTSNQSRRAAKVSYPMKSSQLMRPHSLSQAQTLRVPHCRVFCIC